MLLSVIIPSRGRPDKLRRSIETLIKRAGIGHDQYEILIGLDSDDETLADLVLPPSVIRSVGDRPYYLGQVHDRLALEAHGKYIFIWGDDVLPSEDWGLALATAISRAGEDGAILYPRDPHEPANFGTYPAIPKWWYETAGYFAPKPHPFWFVDTMWNEIGEMIGLKACVPGFTIEHPSGRGQTQSLRDVQFWGQFFDKRRAERERVARAILARIGGIREMTATTGMADCLALLKMKQSHILSSDFARRWPNPQDPPSEKYIRAFSEARQMMYGNFEIPF